MFICAISLQYPYVYKANSSGNVLADKSIGYMVFVANLFLYV